MACGSKIIAPAEYSVSGVLLCSVATSCIENIILQERGLPPF